MKALVKDQNKLSILDVRTPTLDNDSQAIIQIVYVGICRTDLYVAKNLLGKINPIILGHEASGQVIALGDAVIDLKVGDRVAINPLKVCYDCENCKNNRPCYNLQMIGVHSDGAICEYIKIEACNLLKINSSLSLQEAAYLEPIAASLAVLNTSINPNKNGAIYGNNRIAELTNRILKSQGFNKIDLISESEISAKYDFIIETLAESASFDAIIKALKPGGTLIMKSRQVAPLSINCNDLIKKEIKIEAAHYGSFGISLELLESGQLNVKDLIAEEYALKDYKLAFNAAEKSENGKVYIRIN